MSTYRPWWSLTRKMRSVFAAYVTLEAAAVAGELSTGTPGWMPIIGGAIVGGAGVFAGWLTSDQAAA